MTVYLVGAGPGDPGLLTVRGAELLAHADVVVYDRLASPTLLALAPTDATLIAAGKAPGQVDLTQDEINQVLVDQGRVADCVVRLKGGDPFVFGRGGEEAEALAAAGIPFEVVPGITSAIGAAAYAGIPVTHRGVSTHFTVVTGHEDPAKDHTDVDWSALARTGGTLVILMGAGRIGEIAAPARRRRAHARHPGRRGAQRHAARAVDGAGDVGDDRRRGRAGTERDRRGRGGRARSRLVRVPSAVRAVGGGDARPRTSERAAGAPGVPGCRSARAAHDRDHAARVRTARSHGVRVAGVHVAQRRARVLQRRTHDRRSRHPRPRRGTRREHRTGHRTRACVPWHPSRPRARAIRGRVAARRVPRAGRVGRPRPAGACRRRPRHPPRGAARPRLRRRRAARLPDRPGHARSRAARGSPRDASTR